MKTTLLTVATLLLALNTFAQHAYDRAALQQYFQNHRVTFNHPPSPQKTSRDAVEVFALDYDAIDDAYTSITGGDYSRYAWDINRRYSPTDVLTLRYAIVNYDSLLYLDGSNNPTAIPLAAATMHLDSIDIIFAHTNNTGNADTIKVSVLERSSVQVVNPGRNGYHTGTVLWDTMIITTTSLATGGNYEVLGCYPNLQFNQGETFTIRVDFAGDTANKFQVACGSRDDCMGNCLAEPAVVKDNSLLYLNWDAQSLNSGTYGADSIFFDCDQSGNFTVGGCEKIFLQNFSFIPYITANVVFSAILPGGSYALCNGQTELPLIVAGAEPPLTYAWSPTNGLSDPTMQRPLVTSLVNPVTYTVTITDVNNQTVTASVFVTPDQTLCAPSDTFAGTVYFDVNNNGVRDNGEAGAQGVQINVNNATYYLTDTGGHYNFVRLQGLGTHYISVGQLSAYSWLTQPSNNSGAYAFSPGPNHYNLDFGIHVSPDSNNVRMDLIATAMPPRPGFTSSYNVYCQNTLGLPFNGVVQFKYDTLHSYESASPAPDNEDLVAGILTWNVANLPAGTESIYNIVLKTPVAGSLGRIVLQQAMVIPDNTFRDVDSFDNASSIQQFVVGSYDPNDKAVSPVGQGPMHSIKPDANTELTYTIRFQNTGTFYAENVTVTDTIDTDLDMATFKMVKASHNYTLDKNVNMLAWHFNQIMLPDSNTNEPGSHGFIQYKIKPKQSISHLSVIENTAFIYFDFNDAIVTNTTSNLVDFSLGLNSATHYELGVRVYPNPFAGQTNFVINTQQQDLTLRVTDIAGRVVDEIRNIPTPYYTYQSGLITKGLYNFELRNAEGIKARGKLMVQ
ncbi:MAG TPA: T9SS type A sorting domain-containing protein [Chitinophagales bacterium]|nr:T9SS type A sorting domain-containing protein [Chitinophagales bacterium]